jgi:glycosyltransferase involved in cell wall biosynthesis
MSQQSTEQQIRINLITYNNQYGLTNDIKLFKRELEKLYQKHNPNIKLQFNFVNFFENTAPNADINVFFEIVSNIFIRSAKYNVLIPNQEWYYKTWLPYIDTFDLILTKTNYAEQIFNNMTKSKDMVKTISWISDDKYNKKKQKSYKKCLHLAGKSIYKQTQLVIDNWESDFPELHIVYSPRDVKLQRKEQSNIIYYDQRLSDEDLVHLMNMCGVHICPSEAEGFGHYLNEARSCKAVILTTDGFPMKDFITENSGFLIKCSKKKPFKHVMGSRYIMDGDDFKQVVRAVVTTPIRQLMEMGNNARQLYLQNENMFRTNIKTIFDGILEELPNRLVGNQLVEDKDVKLPPITIVTPTYNRHELFKLAVYNFKHVYYPKQSVEWVIVEDSDDGTDVKDLLPTEKDDLDRIKYIHLDSKQNISTKRNIGVENASNEYIVFMDDDDYYPENSILIRIMEMLRRKKDCVLCSSIGCFHINKYISLINVPPHQDPFEKRVSEATLAFTKSFWETCKFDENVKGSEGEGFVKYRMNQCVEVPWKGIIVSLLHSKNISHKATVTDKPNGCHFGWSDELFLFITGLDS